MKILFICTHNRCRSILAEAIANHYGGGLIEARSAGSEAVGEVHPLSLQNLREHNIPSDGLASQSWDLYEDFSPTCVITVCDNAAKEACPVWFGKSYQAHWGLTDPSTLPAGKESTAAFTSTINILKERVQTLRKCLENNADWHKLIHFNPLQNTKS